ncbi:MAG: response regulator [Elusimicrobiota bacterium]|jgi:signal transduction histidine kinase
MTPGLSLPRIRILVVDDEVDNRALLREQFAAVKGWAIEAEEAGDSQTAFNLLRESFFDLVFLDYRLPDEDGLKVLEQIRQLHPKIVVIMVSAAGSEKVAVEAMKRGAMDYITQAELRGTDLEHLLRRAIDVQSLQTENFELRAVNKMKDEFIAGVSHELRTPLAVILGYAKTLEEGEFGTLTAAQKAAVTAIRSRGEQFLQMVNRLLSFKESALGTQHVLLRPVDLHALVSEHLRARWEEPPRGIVIEKDLCGGPVWVLADPEPLAEVLQNLVSNSCKFSPDGTKVTVSLKVRPTNEAWIQIRDQGRGITPEALPHLFEGFYHAEKELTRGIPGLGIGLALSRQIVELHGGRIWIESEGTGRGTTGSIALPITEPDTPQILVESQRKHDKKRILIVENNPGMVEILRMFLAGISENLVISTTHDGQEALEMIERSRYDLMLLDMLLPGVSGLEILERMQRLTPEKRVPTLVITGHRDAAAQAGKLGAADILLKPFYKKAFLDKVFRLLGLERRAAGASRPVEKPPETPE